MTREQECFYLSSYEHNMKKLALCDEYQKLGTVEELQNALELAKNLQQALQHSHSQDRDEAAMDVYLEYCRKQEELTSSPKGISK